MAEFTAFRNVATPYPIYGLPYVVSFPLLDADGDPISPSSPDSEISKNGDTFTDCTNEAVEIATSSGICYLSLTGTELTCDVATIRIQSTGAKTTVLSIPIRKLVTIRTGTSASAGSATSTIVLDGSASAVDDFYNGMIVAAVIDSVTEVRMISDYVGSTQTATVVPDWNTAPDNTDTFTVYLPDGVQIQQSNVSHAANVAWGSGAITAGAIATDAIDADAVADGAINAAAFAAGAITATVIADGAIDAATFAAGAITATVIADGAIDAATFAAGAITATVIAADAIGASQIAANAIGSSELADGAITAAKIADNAIDTATFAAGTTIPRCTLTDTVTTYTGNTPQTGDAYAIVNSGTHGNAAILARTPSATSITNMNTVFATDFAANYNTTADVWNVSLTHWKGTAPDSLIGGRIPSDPDGYVDGYVYVMSGGSAGTTVGTHGTFKNPVALGSDAVTIATSRGIKRIKCIPISSTDTFTLDAADYSGFAFDLNGCRVDINGNDTDTNTRFYSAFAGGTLLDDLFGGPGPLDLKGVYFDSIFLTNPRLVAQTYVNKCAIEGNIVVGATGSYTATFANCYGIQVTTTISMGAFVGSTLTVRLLGWAGDLNITNMMAGMTLEIYGYVGNVTIAASCTGGTVKHSSHHEVTNNGSGMTVELVSDGTLFTTQMTESYAADGVAPTLAQAIFLIQQSLHEFAIASTTRTVKKLDGTTTAATFTLDSATTPTSTTRAS